MTASEKRSGLSNTRPNRPIMFVYNKEAGRLYASFAPNSHGDRHPMGTFASLGAAVDALNKRGYLMAKRDFTEGKLNPGDPWELMARARVGSPPPNPPGRHRRHRRQ